MRTKHLFRILTLALLLLGGGTSPTWADEWKYSNEDCTEGSGGDGTYNFYYEKEYMMYWNADDEKTYLNDGTNGMRWFKTTRLFNADNGDNDCYWWRFMERIVFRDITKREDDNDMKDTQVKGEIYVVTADGQSHKIATYEKLRNKVQETTWSMETTAYGDIHVSDVDYDSGHVYVDYWPSNRAIKEGIKKIKFKNCLYFYDNKDRDSGNFQYEKDLDISSLSETNPMKAITFTWNEDANFDLTAKDMKKFANNDIYQDEYYEYTRYWIRADGKYVSATGTASLNDMKSSETSRNKYKYTGTANWEYTYNSKQYTEGAFTTPVLVQYYRKFDIKPSSDWGFKNFTTQTYNQNNSGVVNDTVQPFTRPETVTVEYNKWDKTNTISWTKREKAKCGATSATAFDVDCSTDGKWYVIRYDKGRDPKEYTEIGYKNGSTTKMEITDDEIQYDKDYVYRVIFLPDVLGDKYANKLASLPGQAAEHNSNDLWEEANANTSMEVTINLSQDRTDSTCVHLVWEYNVKAENCTWNIYKRDNGGKSWSRIASGIPVDTDETSAEYTTDGDPCTWNDYRVMVTIQDSKDCYSNTISANRPTGAYISEITASKGTEESSVVVKWKVANPGDHQIQYSVLRRQIGEDEWTLLTDEVYGTSSEYSYTDTRSQAGSYYEYTVEAVGADCTEQITQSDDIVTPGFSQARGVITGSVTYGSGTAVADVKVNLIKQSSSSDEDETQYLSRYIEGKGKGLIWTADTSKYENKLTGKNDMTLQMWVRPKKGNANSYSSFMTLNGGIELGLKTADGSNYYLYHVDGADVRHTIHNHYDVTFDPGKFTQVTAVYKDSTWTLYTGIDSLVKATSFSPATTKWTVFSDDSDSTDPTLAIGGSYHISNDSTRNFNTGTWRWEPFTGYVDEIRLWSTGLSETKVKKYFDRLLSGKEDGLVLYWPLDEGLNVVKYAFDYACQDGVYQENHPTVGSNTVPRTEVPAQLTLYGLTDSDGNYTIRGVPFSSGGTNYKVSPSYGIHEFNPNSRTMYVSASSLTTNNVDFQDESSFPLSGYLYYAGTNIPVDSAMLYVDGVSQTKDGDFVMTDSEGYYEVDVPIGNHYVEIKASNHTMANGGRYPTQGTTYFGSSMTYDFADSTLVTYCGRVSGGEINDTIPVGFAASNNNIGMATIQLKLNNDSYSFNCQDDHITSATEKRTWDSDSTAINSTAWTGTGDYAKYIYVKTDSLTGEFSVKLPPLSYITKSITVGTNASIEFSSLSEVDLTDLTKVYQDSLEQVNEWGDTVTNYHKYYAKDVYTYRSDPVFEVNQVSINSDRSAPAGVYGLKEIEDHEDDFGTVDITDIWYQDATTGEYKYTYDYPLYQSGDKVVMEAFGYEPYTNYDSGTAVTDTIPMKNQSFTLTNEMSDEQKVVVKVLDESSEYEVGEIVDVKTDEMELGDDGKLEFAWQAGTPNVAAPYTRNISIKYSRNDRTRTWEGYSGIILGSVSNGNNFATAGPDRVTMVIRDAPGASGMTSWQTGSTKTKYKVRTNAYYDQTMIKLSLLTGIDLELSDGLNPYYIYKSTAYHAMSGGGMDINISVETGSTTKETWETTATETISTAARNDFGLAAVTNPSAMGDVFIGSSTNVLIGECKTVDLYRERDGGDFQVDCRDGIGIGDSATTAFRYTAYEVENVQIPKWKDTRNSMFTFVESEAYAQSYENTSDEAMYLCWLSPDSQELDADSVAEYRFTPPNHNTGKEYTDSVNWCNDQIIKWKERLAENEKDKVDAMSNSSKYFKKNVSFDGLTGYNYVSRADTISVRRRSYDHKLGVAFNGGLNVGMNPGTCLKFNFMVDTENGWAYKQEDGDEDNNYHDYAQFFYNLADGNAGTDFSVDIYKSPAGWSDIFVIKAGQSYNPYEGEYVSQYYDKGNHIISYGTTQMEQPDLKISIDGTNPGSSAVLTDVPSGQEAEFTLHLTNNSSTNQGFSFMYNLMTLDTSNPDGLQLMMDGQRISSRSFMINQGETVTKKLRVKQTNQGILDYEGIALMFASSYQTGLIYDIASLDVHFKPSSSDITLKIDEPTLNNETFNDNDSCLVIKLKDYDRQFTNLKSIGVQYRFAGSTQWTTAHTWMTDEKNVKGSSQSLLGDDSELTYNLNMSSDISYPEGEYEFRAFTCTPYDNEDVYVYSDIVAVTKDLTRPRNLYTPDPTNGILGYGDQMSVEFTEDIVPGYVSSTNVIVKARLNSEETDHEVALALNPYGEKPKTVNPVYLNGSFSMEFWLNRHGDGTILQLGEDGTNLALSLDKNGYMTANIAGTQFNTTMPLPEDEWIFCALAYDDDSHMFNLLAEYDTEDLYLFKNKEVNEEDMQAINYGGDNHLYLGGIDADIHGLTLYNIYRDPNEAASEKYNSKDKYVYGLANYWAMNEGHGNVAEDQRHTHDLTVPDSWTIDNLNYALNIENQEGALANMAYVTTGKGDSYAIEMWHKIPAIESIETNPDDDFSGLEQVVFETTSPNVDGEDEQLKKNKLRLYYDTSMNLVLDYGEKSQTVASYDNFPEIASWRHMALNVQRGQNASFYLNGERTAVIAETDVPAFEGSKLLLGKGVKDTKVDELRVWHASLSEDFLKSNIYHVLDTADVRGLVAYYPFEKTGEVYGVTTKVETYEDQAPSSGVNGGIAYEVSSPGTISTGDDCPPLKSAEEETRINTSPVASERKIIINLNTTGISKRELEGTTLNITVDQVHDLNGNTSNPICWTAFVQQNTLKWAKDSVNVFMKYGEPVTFDVDIENKGYEAEYYTLKNMPSWLEPVGSETTDQVAPQKTKRLRFAVDPQGVLPVGNYDVVIGLEGNNEIQEPLLVMLKVGIDGPDWTVDPMKYENNMSVVGQAYINGKLLSNPDSRLAAFVNDECRGVTAPEKIRGAAYLPLTVYGNDEETLSFRIWDANTGTVYSNVSVAIGGSAVEDMTFNASQDYGTFDNPVIFTNSTTTEQPLQLTKGWNWLSLSVVPTNADVSVVFKDVTSWEARLKNHGTGVAYCNGSAWNGSLTQVEANTMYKLYLSRLESSTDLPSPMIVNGEQVDLDETPVTLNNGWNWIAYLPTNSLPIETALAAANPKQGDQVKSQRGFSYYGPHGWEGNLTLLENGKGYLYKSTDEETKTFCYPSLSVSRSLTPDPSRRGEGSIYSRGDNSAEEVTTPLPTEGGAGGGAVGAFAPVDPTDYPDNMTMAIKLTDGDAAITDAEVAAFIDGECRGAAVADDDLYYLLIAGEGSGQAMEIRVAIGGEIYTVDTSLTYRSDGNIGTPWEPYVIDLSDLAVGIRTVAAGSADNTEWYNLQGMKLDRKPTTPGVYIHNGEKVTIKVKKMK